METARLSRIRRLRESSRVLVENFITGEWVTCNQAAFKGVLKLEIAEILDQEALIRDYQGAHEISVADADEDVFEIKKCGGLRNEQSN